MYEKMIKKVIEEEMKEYESRTQILHESVVSYWYYVKKKDL